MGMKPIIGVRTMPQIRCASSDSEHLGLIDLSKLRNVAIIAHVDHGKTTLVDQLLKTSGATMSSENTRVMDSNALEKERGITILSKATCITYKGHRINIRVLSMVDGVILVVCATEGPMTQTRFVLGKALSRGLKPLPSARINEVDNELLDLFLALEANDEQTEYPIAYASAKEEGDRSTGMTSLLDMIVDHVPPPVAEREAPSPCLLPNPYLGKCYLGRITSGILRTGDKIKALDTEGKIAIEGRCIKMLVKRGLESLPVDEAGAGDIVSIAGMEGAFVNHTICSYEVSEPLPYIPIDPPTISMYFFVNDSPLGGQEGKYLTSQMLRERLIRECETNPALHMTPQGEYFEVRGRGELQMGVLIETMRREGFELSVSPPRVIFKMDNAEGEKKILEPIEEVTIDVEHGQAGTVIEKMTSRKGMLLTYTELSGRARLIFEVPTRGLLGYPAEFKSDTSGQGTLNHILKGYEAHKGPLDKSRKGSIISTASGETTAYSLRDIEARGKLFVTPGVKVYPGMIIGEHNRDSDLEVNPAKAKHLTNMRASGKEEQIRLTPVEAMGLERLMSYIQDDEVIEVTPSAIRSRKKELDANKRKSNSRRNADMAFL
ncbi:hypothetical protein BC829DRAFT_388809 [Chytridium lagenaria]|nr:hypothetical protein BC829DRAFT_388809 [Chytridium lagenaria]